MRDMNNIQNQSESFFPGEETNQQAIEQHSQESTMPVQESVNADDTDSSAGANPQDKLNEAVLPHAQNAQSIQSAQNNPITPTTQSIAPMSAPINPASITNPFNLNFNLNDSVSLNSGASNYRINVLSIPGCGGMDMNLDLLYDSSRAIRNAQGIFHEGFENGLNPAANVHGIGAGWVYDIPRFDGRLLSLPGRGSYAINSGGFINRRLTDMQLVIETIPISAFPNSFILHRVICHDGTTYAFDGRRITSVTDRFGNAISFDWSGSNGSLRRIINSNGSVIEFETIATGNNRIVRIP